MFLNFFLVLSALGDGFTFFKRCDNFFLFIQNEAETRQHLFLPDVEVVLDCLELSLQVVVDLVFSRDLLLELCYFVVFLPHKLLKFVCENVYRIVYRRDF